VKSLCEKINEKDILSP